MYMDMKKMTEQAKQKKIKNFSTTRIGIEVVNMKKLRKQEVIGMRMHQFKVSGLNSVHLICDSYFEFFFFMITTSILFFCV